MWFSNRQAHAQLVWCTLHVSTSDSQALYTIQDKPRRFDVVNRKVKLDKFKFDQLLFYLLTSSENTKFSLNLSSRSWPDIYHGEETRPNKLNSEDLISYFLIP